MNAEQLSQMQHMLSGCLLPDNAQRKAAEAVITQHLNEHREVFIYGLIKLVRTSPESQVSGNSGASDQRQAHRH